MGRAGGGRPLHRAGAMAGLPRAGARATGARGRRAAVGSGGDEHADGQPAPADGQLLPAGARAPGHPDGSRRLPDRPPRGGVADPVPRFRPGHRPDRGRTGRSRWHRVDGRHRTRHRRTRPAAGAGAVAGRAIPQRPGLRRGRDRAAGACARRAGRFRPRPRGRQPATGLARQRCRFRRVVPLQIPQRRAGRSSRWHRCAPRWPCSNRPAWRRCGPSRCS